MHNAEKRRKFDDLARALSDDLFRFALWLSRDPALAQDLVQETFLRAWRAMDSLQSPDAAKSWLLTILRREYARTFERKRHPTIALDNVDVVEEGIFGPEEDAEQITLQRAVVALEEKYREPLLLQVLMGMSIKEIAGQLELSESAVMTRVFRARAKLKAILLTTEDTENHRGKTE